LSAPKAWIFKNDRELFNGRAAMIGIASLLAVEAFTGVPFVDYVSALL